MVAKGEDTEACIQGENKYIAQPAPLWGEWYFSHLCEQIQCK